MIDEVAGALGAELAAMARRLAGTLLSPGSSFSLLALAITLLVLLMLAIPRGRQLRFAVLRRALFPRRIWKTASGRTDIAYFASSLVFAGSMVGWAILSADQIRGWTSGMIGTGASPLPDWARAAILTPLLFLAYEFAYWLDHMLMHRVPVLWHFHKVHHQAESLSLFTNARVHPVETIGFYNLVALITGITAALAERAIGPASPLLIGGANALILLSQLCLTHLQHSHFWIGFGPRWGRWLLGPAHHQIHHSADPAHFNRNFGASLAIFDRLFRTLHMPAARREALGFGVEDGAANPHGWHAALVAPVTGAIGEVLGSPETPVRAATVRR